jgi:hypothetical protein
VASLFRSTFQIERLGGDGFDPTAGESPYNAALDPVYEMPAFGMGDLSKSTLVADFVDHYAPYRVCSVVAIWHPLIDSIEALRPNVARQNPQKSISKS